MKIENLTPKQCVEIAKLVYPDIEWKYRISKSHRWQGHDLVGDVIDAEFSEFNDYFQISFSNTYSYFDAGLNEWKINGEEKAKIDKYIEQL